MFGGILFVATDFYNTNSEVLTFIDEYSESIVFASTENSAACDNMFVGTEHQCNESTANCGPGVGGTGYNLSCTIRCDNKSTINCGTDDEVIEEVAGKLSLPCSSDLFAHLGQK